LNPPPNRKPSPSSRNAPSPEGVLGKGLVIAVAVRLGMMLLMPIAAVMMFVLSPANRVQHQLSGLVRAVVLVAPVVLALWLFFWAQRKPRQEEKDYRAIPILLAVLSFVITALPLPGIDRTPTLGDYLLGRADGVRTPLVFKELPGKILGLFDECAEYRDCKQGPDGIRRTCAADREGDRVCVVVAPGGCCPTKAGCTQGWSCVVLGDPSRAYYKYADGSSHACVPEEVASRFDEHQPSPPCDKPRTFGDSGPYD